MIKGASLGYELEIGLKDSIETEGNSNPLHSVYNEKEGLFLFSSHEDIFKEITETEEEKRYSFYSRLRSKDNFYFDFDDEDLLIFDFGKKEIRKKKVEKASYSSFVKPKKESKNITYTSSPKDTDFIFDNEVLEGFVSRKAKEGFMWRSLEKDYGFSRHDLYSRGFTTADLEYLTIADVSEIYAVTQSYKIDERDYYV